MNIQSKILYKGISFIVLIIIWAGIHTSGLVDKSLLPNPLTVFIKIGDLFTTSRLFSDIFATLIRMLTGYFLATLVGVLVGLSIGLVLQLYEASIVIVDFFRSIPVTALYPIFVLFFGIGNTSKIAMVFWACFFVIVLNSAYGVIQSKKLRSKMAELYGASKFQIFRWITFFDALPQTMIGLRVAISFALIVEILTEMFMGSEYGIGQSITEAYTRYSMEELFAFIFLTGIIGYTFNRIFIYFEKKLTFWVI